jgi:hypothetical protein
MRSLVWAGRVRALSTRVPFEAAAVHNTMHRFFHILDGLEPDAPLSALFAPGGTLAIEKAGVTLGAPEEIDAWCVRMRRGWDAPTLHTEGNIVLDAPSAGLVVARSTWSALVGGTLASYGTHDDVLEAVEGGTGTEWRFRRRIVRHLYSAT